MAATMSASFETVLSEELSSLGLEKLQPQQKLCLQKLVEGNDVLAILPTGFGKSLIYQLFPRLFHRLRYPHIAQSSSTILVITALTAIIDDQVKYLNDAGFRAAAINSEADAKIIAGEIEIVYGSPEIWLSNKWIKILKDSQLGKQIIAIAVDEVHSVTEWGQWRPKKKRKGKQKLEPFREAFGRVKELRSHVPQRPMLALTASLKLKDRANLIKACGLVSPTIIDASPNKSNIRFSFVSIEKEKEALRYISWVADLLLEKGEETPQTIIFCKTFNAISMILSYLLMLLERKAFIEKDGNTVSLIGVYHSKTWDTGKKDIESSFKANGYTRVVIATTALGMGVNFPSIRYVVCFGPSGSITEQMQQAGRAGRDGKPADCIVYWTKRQIVDCESDMKSLLEENTCFRVALYKPFDTNLTCILPGHQCCSLCLRICNCLGESCSQEMPFFMKPAKPAETVSEKNICKLTEVDLKDLQAALNELKTEYSSKVHMGILYQETLYHGFSDELIADTLLHADKLFCYNTIKQFLPVYSVHHIKDILEILQELFEDIDDFDSQIEELSSRKIVVGEAEDYLAAIAAVTENESPADQDGQPIDPFPDFEGDFLPEFELSF